MRAVLSHTICLVCLLLGMGIMALWVRSHHRGDSFANWWVDRENRVVYRRQFESGNKSLLYRRYDERFLDPDHEWSEVIYAPGGMYDGGWEWRSAPGTVYHPTHKLYQRLGFDVRVEWKQMTPYQPNVQRTIITVRVPNWLVAGLFAMPSAVWAIRRVRLARRARRLRRGLCPACGYDLRATPAGGTCPECGQVVKPAAGGGDQSVPANGA